MRHPAIGAARCLGGRGSVGRIRHSRHPAMGLAYGILWNGSVHQALGSFINLLYGERDKGGSAPPLSIPAAPRGNRCCALRSPPACLTAAGSTRLTRSMLERVPVSVRLCPPSMASRPCHSRFGSPISAGTQPPRCHIAKKSNTGVAVGSFL